MGLTSSDDMVFGSLRGGDKSQSLRVLHVIGVIIALIQSVALIGSTFTLFAPWEDFIMVYLLWGIQIPVLWVVEYARSRRLSYHLPINFFITAQAAVLSVDGSTGDGILMPSRLLMQIYFVLHYTVLLSNGFTKLPSKLELESASSFWESEHTSIARKSILLSDTWTKPSFYYEHLDHH